MSNLPAVAEDFFPDVADKTPLELRSSIYALEERMLELPQVEMPPTHRFADGLYAREITIPKDTLLTGAIHRREHINIISKGRIAVLTEDGVRIVEAPCTLVSRPGTKRVGYALEETVWTTVHATCETDVERLEAELVTNSHNDLISDSEILQLKEAIACLS